MGRQVLLDATYHGDRLGGLAIVRAGLVGIVFGTVFLLCYRRGLEARRAAFLALGAFIVAAPALALRPQLIAMALFALTLLLVVERHEHPRRLWLVPFIAIIWANVHGSFFLAPAVLGLAWLADLEGRAPERRSTLIVAVATAIACCVTPFGPFVWAYAAGLGANPDVIRRISEWQPTTLRDVQGVLFFGSALVVAAFLARRGDATPWPTLLWLAFFFVIGAYAVRGIAWWPLGVVAAIIVLLEPASRVAKSPAETQVFRIVNAGVAVALVVACVAALPFWRPIDPGTGAPDGTVSYAPSGITSELKRIAGTDERIFNPQPWGSWFEFAVPQTPVAIDSRIELFPTQVWDDYVRITAGAEGWEGILDRWGVTVAVVAAADSGLRDRLIAAGWTETYVDADGSVLQPNGLGPSGSGSTASALLESAR